MGNSFSEPIPTAENDDVVCIVFRGYDKIRIVGGSEEVIDGIGAIVQRCLKREDVQVEKEDKFGALQFRVPGTPFVSTAAPNSILAGKIYALKILKLMLGLGFELLCSSDLSRAHDQGTWIFRRSTNAKPLSPPHVLCLSPFRIRKLALINGTLELANIVKDVLNETWTTGILGVKNDMIFNEPVNAFKLRGCPWNSEGPESIASRKLLSDLILRLGTLRWRLITSINLHGNSDSLFFVFDPDQSHLTKEVAIISLHYHNKLRMLGVDRPGYKEIKKTVEKHLQRRRMPDERDFYGILELKLKSSPFMTSDIDEAIRTRKFFCRLFENLHRLGWSPATAITVSRRFNNDNNNKPSIVFNKSDPMDKRYACVALMDTNRLILINFPPNIMTQIHDLVTNNYLPGVAMSKERETNVFSMILHGLPWTQHSCFGLHARWMLMKLVELASTLGWTPSLSCDVSSKFFSARDSDSDHKIDPHSLFFVAEGRKKSAAPSLDGQHITVQLQPPSPHRPDASTILSNSRPTSVSGPRVSLTPSPRSAFVAPPIKPPKVNSIVIDDLEEEEDSE